MKCSPLSPAVLWFVNVRERKPTQKKKSSEKKIKGKNGENAPHIETTEVILVHCNAVDNNFQKDSRVLHAFNPNKSFGLLLDSTA